VHTIAEHRLARSVLHPRAWQRSFLSGWCLSLVMPPQEQYIERCLRALGSPRFPAHLTLRTDPAVTTLAAVGA
jgi:hypothetical protein